MQKSFVGRFSGIVLSCGLSLGLAACSGGGGGSGSGDRAPNVPDIDLKSCVYDTNDGLSADFSQLNQKSIETTSFNKAFNSAYLKAIGKANIPSSIEFINSTEAQVYQASSAPTQMCSRQLFAGLPSMPTDLNNKWNEASEGGDENSILLGLYLPKNSTGLHSTGTKAAIILRSNTSRWTLVHEFMHHVFMLEAVSQGYSQEANRQQLLTSLDRYKQIDSNTSLTDDQKIDQQSDNFVTLVQAFDTQLVHFTLEEMTIEKLMKEYLASAKLAFAPESSNWYIHASAETANESLNNIRKFGSALKSMAQTRAGHAAAVSKLETSLSLIDSRLMEIYRIDNAFPAPRSVDHRFMLTLGLETHEGCSHMNEAAEILELSKELL